MEIQCPKCGSTQISANKRGWSLATGMIGSGKIILTCMKCGKQFRPGEDKESVEVKKQQAAANKKKPLNWIILIMAMGIIFLVGKACFSVSDDKAADQTSSLSKKRIDSLQKVIKNENWTYKEDNSDKMQKRVIYMATCKSIGKMELSAPYDGGSTMVVIIRNGFKGKANEVIILVDKGQFMSSIDGNEKIRVKFDDEKPASFSFNDAADGSSNYAFLNNSAGFLSKLKKAKHLVVECQFYDNGIRQAEFNTEGLKWDH
jgi:DNA-directed RNA polymerase subunit RPC12/RpoP